jgi:hypothetical protein
MKINESPWNLQTFYQVAWRNFKKAINYAMPKGKQLKILLLAGHLQKAGILVIVQIVATRSNRTTPAGTGIAPNASL